MSGLHVGVADVLDMILVASLIYALLVWFKQTKTAFVAMGIPVLALVYTVARIMGMYMTVWIFQEELRHIFERIAVWSLHGGANEESSPNELEILVHSVANFARDRIGALIVLHGLDPLGRHIEGGWDLNGVLSEAILESIFDSHSLGHDGAVLIEHGKVTRFGCLLPLSKDFAKMTNLGTRHTAALGLAERSDALALVVSEEKGTISVAERGQLKVMPDLQVLEETVERFFLEKAPRPTQRTLADFFRHNTREKAIAVGVSILMWLFFIGIGPR